MQLAMAQVLVLSALWLSWTPEAFFPTVNVIMDQITIRIAKHQANLAMRRIAASTSLVDVQVQLMNARASHAVCLVPLTVSQQFKDLRQPVVLLGVVYVALLLPILTKLLWSCGEFVSLRKVRLLVHLSRVTARK